MGCKPIPNYANIFVAKLDNKILEIARQIINSCIIPFKRFLDDIFSIWNGTTRELHTLFEAMNRLHPTIKFTMNHTSQEKMKNVIVFSSNQSHFWTHQSA